MSRQIGFFIFVGATGFIVDASLTQTFVSFAGLDAYIARFPAICVAVLVTYILNKTLTFKAKDQTHRKSLPLYIATTALAQGGNYALYAGLLKVAPIWRAYPFFAVAIGSVCAAIITFLLSKYWVFKSHE